MSCLGGADEFCMIQWCLFVFMVDGPCVYVVLL
jgi:hypothetical protein